MFGRRCQAKGVYVFGKGAAGLKRPGDFRRLRFVRRSHCPLREDEPRLMGEGRHEMERAFPIDVLFGAAHSLAVDGNNTADALGQTRRPRGKCSSKARGSSRARVR
jgi:hypothetical protein